MKMKLNMLNSKKILVGLMSLFLITLLIGCDEDTTPSLWDSYNPPAGTKPVIDNIAPEGESLAGVDVVTITGSGFNPTTNLNIVYFGSMQGKVLEATATQMKVLAPNNPKDTLQVKCSWTKGNDNFSEPKQYRLRVAAGEAVKVANRAPNCMTVDKAGNIYIHAKNSKTEKEIGFIKIAPDGTETTFAPTGSATSSVIFTTMKCGPDNNLLCIRSATKAIFEVKENTAAKAWASGFAGNIADFDFDNKGYVWAGGASGNAQLYRISYSNPKRMEKYAFTGDVKSVRYFQSALYVAATRDNAEKLIKIPVVSDSVLDVANAVEYFDFTSAYPNVQIKSITISQDGTIYAGNSDTTSTTVPPIIMVKTDKTSEIFFSVLLGDAIYASPVQSLAWGIADDLYYLRGKTSAHTQEVVRVITKKYSAPYYGRGDL
jgi:hypothetical protein